MEISVRKEALSEAFGIAQAIATTRTTRPVLQNAFIQTTAGMVTISATDMEIGIIWKIPAEDCKVAQDGAVLLSASRMAQITRNIEADEITLKTEENSCVVKGGRSVFNVMTENVEDFPSLPGPSEEAALEIEAEKFARMTKETIFAAARESTRYALNGVHIQVAGGLIEMVATDGRRMALVTEKVDKNASMPAAIVPQKALAQVERLKAAEDENLKIFIQERQVFFSTAAGTVTSILVEGHFPPYKEVVPKENDKKAKISRAALLSAMRQTAIMTSEDSKSVLLSFAPGELTVTGRAPEEGSGEVKVDIEFDGEPVEVRFNPHFVIEALSAIESDDVTVEMKSPSDPAMITDGSGFVYVVMPINIA
ncbi:MAG: DNA polymerase III subunit beta [Planctomycetes bacterium]|nr:DNA polymerase III subunit beta [Planctomycetota bacterium]